VAKVPPKQKPKRDRFAMVEKLVRNLQRSAPPPTERNKTAKKETTPTPVAPAERAEQLTISELDFLRRQLWGCWSVPAGAKEAGKLVVHVRVLLNPDGEVRRAHVIEQSRMHSDPFFRVAAESALRAVLKCSPLRLPPGKYSEWKEITLKFDPKELVGS
jgi:hypothetical protein